MVWFMHGGLDKYKKFHLFGFDVGRSWANIYLAIEEKEKKIRSDERKLSSANESWYFDIGCERKKIGFGQTRTKKNNKSFNIPLGNKLFFLVHVIFGIGLPVAEHSNRTGDPFFTCKWPPDVTWFILGGTELIANIKFSLSERMDGGEERRRRKCRNETLN